MQTAVMVCFAQWQKKAAPAFAPLTNQANGPGAPDENSNAATVLLCIIGPANATSGSFALIHKLGSVKFLPHCHDPNLIEAAPCNCMVPVVAERITEAEAARFTADPAARRDIAVRIDMPSVTFFCLRLQKPPPL